jgi:Domain of unknown function (DUF4919)
VLTLLLCQLFAFTQEAQKSQPTTYVLAGRLKNNDRSVGFKELRLAYAGSPNIREGPDTDKQKKAMMAARNSHDFGAALKNADIVLASDYVEMDAQFVEYIANRELKASDQAEFYKFVFQGLSRSITDSKDGKTPDTAFRVIEVHEEYGLLRSMGVGLPESQALLHKNGHAYDEIKGKDPASNQEVTIYFNVDIPAKRGL